MPSLLFLFECDASPSKHRCTLPRLTLPLGGEKIAGTSPNDFIRFSALFSLYKAAFRRDFEGADRPGCRTSKLEEAEALAKDRLPPCAPYAVSGTKVISGKDLLW